MSRACTRDVLRFEGGGAPRGDANGPVTTPGRTEGPGGSSHPRGRAVLESFGRVLRLESHNLIRRPDLLWQQCYNELQWEGGGVEEALAPELAGRSGPDGVRWLHRKTPLRHGGLLQTLAGHTGKVNTCAVSPDGTWVVSASDDGTARIWNPLSGEERQVLAGHTAAVNTCAVSPDGTWVVSASDDATARIWNPFSGEERQVLAGHTGKVNTCAVSPDGAWIVSASDEEVRVWDALTGDEAHVFPVSLAKACAWGPDGTWFVTAGPLGTAMWSRVTGTQRFDVGSGQGVVECCAVSPDGMWVAEGKLGHAGGTLCLSDAATGTERAVVQMAGEMGQGLRVEPRP